MISFFPAPYPDELWYSVICRFHVRSGNYCAKHTMQQLYGDTYRTPSLMLCMSIIPVPIAVCRLPICIEKRGGKCKPEQEISLS